MALCATIRSHTPDRDVTGVAFDPAISIAATATELNSQVEFYDLAKKTAITFANLSCTNDQIRSIAAQASHWIYQQTVPRRRDERLGSGLMGLLGWLLKPPSIFPPASALVLVLPDACVGGAVISSTTPLGSSK